MGKRYYCDYCDRSFKADNETRKKHLASLQHVKSRNEHYNLYKDPEVILQEERAKNPCRNHLTFGNCAFGSSCRFSHYTPSMMQELEHFVAERRMGKNRNNLPINWPDHNEIIRDFFELGDTESPGELEKPTWERPAELWNYPTLPPSLWPITPQTLHEVEYSTWGSQNVSSFNSQR